MGNKHSSSGSNFGGSGKVSKANKRKRENDREDVRRGNSKKLLKLSKELREWHESNTLYKELDKRNTADLKIICEENGIKRSGAKYEITASIHAHIEGYYKQQEKLKLEEDVKNQQNGNLASERLEVLNIKSLESVNSYCEKFQVKKLDKENDIAKKIDMLCGLTQGVCDQVLTAVTGPKRNKYNGKHGELAEDLLNFLSEDILLNFFNVHLDQITIQQFQSIILCMSARHGMEGYGHYNILARVGDSILELFENKDEFSIYLSEKLDSVDQYGRKRKVKTKELPIMKSTINPDSTIITTIPMNENKENIQISSVDQLEFFNNDSSKREIIEIL